MWGSAVRHSPIILPVEQLSWLTGKLWGLSKKLSDLGKESNKAKILLQ